jgi:hypothetical protein
VIPGLAVRRSCAVRRSDAIPAADPRGRERPGYGTIEVRELWPPL